MGEGKWGKGSGGRGVGEGGEGGDGEGVEGSNWYKKPQYYTLLKRGESQKDKHKCYVIY